MWVRGLKHNSTSNLLVDKTSHPMWVRGLKLAMVKASETKPSRTPCGCVD